MPIGKGLEQGWLSEEDIRELSARALAQIPLRNKRVLAIIPDHTRTAPVDLFFKLIYELIGHQTKALDYLVALGTHPVLSEEKLLARVGITKQEWQAKYKNVHFFAHQWDRPDALTTIGTISADEIEEISGGLMHENVPVTINKLIYDYDHIFIIGPTFPHEVVGFSGGNKYFFPGIAGAEIIDFFHWLGAVITNLKIIGRKWTATRAVVDRAAQFIDLPKLCFSLVVGEDKKLAGLYIGSPEEAWSAAADLSEKLHIEYKDHPYHLVLGIAPTMYDDIWTAGKVMYKSEPIVADGGEVVIYAPHISEISYTHGKILDEIGYHVRDYFLKQMERFRHIPRAVLAHSTHVRGIGTFEDGIEKPRVQVTLATAIPEERCRLLNLGYRNPRSIEIEEYLNREEEGILVIPHAGEKLFRLRSNKGEQ